MRVICDNCPFLSDGWGFEYCALSDQTKINQEDQRSSDSCRLIKIVTLDGDILPEEAPHD